MPRRRSRWFTSMRCCGGGAACSLSTSTSSPSSSPSPAALLPPSEASSSPTVLLPPTESFRAGALTSACVRFVLRGGRVVPERKFCSQTFCTVVQRATGAPVQVCHRDGADAA
eukprot:1522400-Rhodomonas_salina.1